jgi:hypothetical protein
MVSKITIATTPYKVIVATMFFSNGMTRQAGVAKSQLQKACWENSRVAQ